ncbi:MAG: carboxypeptidase-like regulatory domain-containing protein, partial [Bacteroidales bacterium]
MNLLKYMSTKQSAISTLRLCAVLMGFMFSSTVYAQQPTRASVTGKIVDNSGEALPGATVVVKGTTKGTIADIDGNYEISGVKSSDYLVFSFIGMKTQEIAVGSQSRIDVSLESDNIGLDKVVAVGYG